MAASKSARKAEQEPQDAGETREELPEGDDEYVEDDNNNAAVEKQNDDDREAVPAQDGGEEAENNNDDAGADDDEEKEGKEEEEATADDQDDGDNDAEEEEDQSAVDEDGEDQKETAVESGTKRKSSSKSQPAGSVKKQKTTTNGSQKQQKNHNKIDTSKPNAAAAEGKVGTKHDEPRDPSTRGSAERLPKPGQQVHWKALPGYVEGEVVEILTSPGKEIEGRQVKASKGDPRIVLRSAASGKICVHKAEAVYFED